MIVGNGGSYGGGVRVGTPYTGDNRNYDTDSSPATRSSTTAAPTSPAASASSPAATATGRPHNAICGNFSAEYGGAMTAFGYQANRLGSQRRHDHAATASGSTPPTTRAARSWSPASCRPTRPSSRHGTGPVTIDANVIHANLANDDGGGIRLLQASGSHVTRTTPGSRSRSPTTPSPTTSRPTRAAASPSTTRPFVDIVDNTVAKNMTTATAVTSDGTPAPAGLSTAAEQRPAAGPAAQHRAVPGLARRWRRRPSASRRCWTTCSPTTGPARFSGGYVYGIGGTLPDGTANDVNNWDMGVVGRPGRAVTRSAR